MKKFLEENKIYFEIFSMTFLGLMAVIVSYTQWRTSNQEFELHKNENMPLIKIDYTPIKSSSSDFYDTEILTVSNEGKIVKRFNKEFFSFYTFNFSFSNNKHTKIHIPVADFFGVSYNTNNLSGKLFDSFSYGNNSNIVNIERYCQTFFSKKDIFITPTREVYFEFKFTDINNQNHTIYMDTHGNEITEKDYNEMKTELKSHEPSMMVMNQVTDKFIDKLVDEQEKL